MPRSRAPSASVSRTAPLTTSPAQPLPWASPAIRSPTSAVCSEPWPSTTSTAPPPGSDRTCLTRALSWKQATVRIGPWKRRRPPSCRSWRSQLCSASPCSSTRSAVRKSISPPFCYLEHKYTKRGAAMSQRWVPAVFMRGGTSKGLFFHAGDLPADPGERDRLLLASLGSPDPFGRQLDGMGGGISSLSKAAVIGPPTRPGADVDYTFAQVAVDRPVVDLGANCGNLSSAVGPFAVDQGLCPSPDGPALVRIHNTNTGRLLQASFAVRDGRAETRGELAIPGVAGTGAPVRLDFLDPGGARTGRLLPTGRPVDEVDLDGAGRFRLSLVDAANPAVFVAAAALGLDGTESPDELEARPEVMALLDRLRRRAGVLRGLAAAPGAVEWASPKPAVLSPPRPFRTP